LQILNLLVLHIHLALQLGDLGFKRLDLIICSAFKSLDTFASELPGGTFVLLKFFLFFDKLLIVRVELIDALFLSLEGLFCHFELLLDRLVCTLELNAFFLFGVKIFPGLVI